MLVTTNEAPMFTEDIKPFLRAGLTVADFETEFFQQMVADREALVQVLAETFADKLSLALYEVHAHVTTPYDHPRFLGPRGVAKY